MIPRLDLRIIAAVMSSLLIACGTPVQASPAQGAEPVSVQVQHDGVIVTLSAAAGRAVAGEPLPVRVDVLNAGLDTVSWQSGGCELLNGFAVDGPPLAQPPAGRDWPDAAGLAKWSATTGGVFIEWVRRADAPQGLPVVCPADLRYEDIDPGQTITAEAVWSGRSSDGVPAPPGAYEIAYSFPFMGRVPADQLGLEPPAPRPIDTALTITVEGTAFEGLPSTMAIDAALADPRVSAWIDQKLPNERLNGAEIRLVDGRWRFTIHVAGERSTVVLIDPSTGTVEDVRLAD